MLYFTPDECRSDPRRVLSHAAAEKILVCTDENYVYSIMPFSAFAALANTYGVPYRYLLIDIIRPFCALHPNPAPDLRLALSAAFFRLQSELCHAWARGIPATSIREALAENPRDTAQQLSLLNLIVSSYPPTRPRDVPALEFAEACHRLREAIPLSDDGPLAIMRREEARAVAVSATVLSSFLELRARDPYPFSLWTTLCESAAPFFHAPAALHEDLSLEIFAVAALLIDAYDRRLPFDALRIMLNRLRSEPGGLAAALSARDAASVPH